MPRNEKTSPALDFKEERQRRQHEATAERRGHLPWLLFLLIPLFVVTLWFYGKQRAERQNLAHEGDLLQETLSSLKQRKEKLSERLGQGKDEAYVEDLARQNLGMVRKDEVVFENAETD